jgi:hypothetical protein
VEIVVYDDIAPTITGTNFYNTLVTTRLDVHSLKLSLEATDNIDGDLSNNIILNEDTYSENCQNEGNYYLSFYVCDSNGNISLPFKIKISVSKDLSYLQTINNSTIYLPLGDLKSDEEILKILNIDSNKYTNIISLSNDYLPNYSNEGNYKITYQIQHSDYTKETFNVNLVTYKDNTIIEEKLDEKSFQQETKKETIFSKIVSFFKSLFSNVVSYFKKLF